MVNRMGNPWLSKKAFLYFGGAFVLLLGGVIVLIAPYHYTGYIVEQGDTDAFEMWTGTGFHSQLEIAVLVRPVTNNSVQVDITFSSTTSSDVQVVNMTLSEIDSVPSTDRVAYEKRVTIDLDYGNYTIDIDRIDNASNLDISYTQLSDSRTFIVTGGLMNIAGLVMGALGYCVKGSFIPSGDEAIVDWGYDEY